MFTGLVETTGTLASTQPTAGAARLTITAPGLAGRWSTGDSIAVNGVCLTAIPLADPAQFAADLAEETVRRTTLAQLRPGDLINLELPTPAGAPLGGHVVQGHVDGTGTLVALLPVTADLDTTDWRMTIELPAELTAFVLPQGSITIDGISLTVARVNPASPESGRTRIEIAVIPHTYRNTHLRSLAEGAPLNIETDVLAKYAARQAGASPDSGQKTEWLTGAYLIANGY